MDKTIPNSTDDDSTKHSTQDRHDKDISSNPHLNFFLNKNKNKNQKPFNDFDSDEDNDGDNKT